ncbi:MAG: hypothetical protein ACHQCE_07660 [Streptosporangiales bacterium]
MEVIGVLVDLGGTRSGLAREGLAPRKKRGSTMKPTTWLALGATAFVALALFAGKDDIRRFRRMYRM